MEGVPDLHVAIIGTIHNWQMVFFIVGLPGLIVAALMLTVVEPPRRGRFRAAGASSVSKVPWRTVLEFVAENWRCYLPMFFAMGLSTVVHSGSAAWSIVFFQRTYEWTPVQAGYALGLVALITSPIGMLVGAWLTERYAARGYDDANMRVLAWASTFAVPWSILAPLMPSPWLAVSMTAIGGLIFSIGSAPMSASLQLVTPNEMRGRVSAIYLFIANVLGTGFGPTAIAMITDLVFHDEAQLRYSLVLAALFTWIPAACYWYARKPYREAVIRARSRH
jgi:hypothetical protein